VPNAHGTVVALLGAPMMRKGFFLAILACFLTVIITTGVWAQTPLINETFEDTSYGSRGWYDGTGGALSTAEKFAGTRSFECRFATGATRCSAGTLGRHLFANTESVYFSYYIKHSANWLGSGKSYHPHMFLFMTNLDGDYIGPAYTHMTAYIEENAGVPVFTIQDGRNIDETKIGVNLTSITEQRSVAGCNGDSDGYGIGQCYSVGSVHWNGKVWPAGQVYFENNAGPRYKGDWHRIEAFFQLNSVSNGVGVRDGIVRLWYDGALIMEHTNIVMRTGTNAAMKFRQFQMAPYIGDGSPVDQTIWIDNLIVGMARPGAAQTPAPPSNLRIIQ
jgi:hypothetical protein